MPKNDQLPVFDLNALGIALTKLTQWAIFETNDERTWAVVRQQVSDHLHDLYSRGMLKGQTVEEAFFVRCGSQTSTNAGIGADRLSIELGVARFRPAEFEALRITHTMAARDL